MNPMKHTLWEVMNAEEDFGDGDRGGVPGY